MCSINSKKLISFIYIISLGIGYTLAQTPIQIYTPLGTPVFDTYTTPELAQWEIDYLNQLAQTNYPNATLINTASGTYNCHGYAWHMNQGGGAVWLGYYTNWAEDIYWQDGSYAETSTQQYGQKVSYLPDYESNHSAITTTVNNTFRSKWGQGPVMQHSFNYCPYYFPGSTTLKLYYNPWPTGIEDWINITLSVTHYPINQTFVGTITRTFVDELPYGDYIVEWYPWQIKAYHSCGEVLVYETENTYINIPNLPDGYQWQRDANGHVIAEISTSGRDNTGHTHYASRPITIGNVPNNFITSGNITSNTNWRGCVQITGTITVMPGITLTIHPDAHIVFQNNASLTVFGTLNATNCELDGGLNSWGSIYFVGSTSANSVIDNVTIRNGGGVRCYSGANVIIKNSLIDHCTEGVYIYNSQPQILTNQIIEPVQNGINVDASGYSPLILHNTITKTNSNPQYHQYQGIIFANNTNGYIAHNDISGFMWGIYIGGGSDALFTNY
jgi:hypothetical protein